jgi:putative oxidoreductase
VSQWLRRAGSLNEHQRNKSARLCHYVSVTTRDTQSSRRDDLRTLVRPFSEGSWALPLRAIVGYGMMAHGFAKLSRGPASFGAILHGLGVPSPHVMAWATVLVELFGGLAVLSGAFVPLASVPLTVVLLVAMLTVHLPYGFSSIKLLAITGAGAQFGPPGYETDLLYVACLAALVIGGSGPVSIDGLLARRSRNHRSDSPASAQRSLS